jgi:hypothetical protein
MHRRVFRLRGPEVFDEAAVLVDIGLQRHCTARSYGRAQDDPGEIGNQ